MPLPSLFSSEYPARAWNVARSAIYGAALGALAALFKTAAPFAGDGRNFTDKLPEIASAALAFAVLCAAAAALRNFLVRRLLWHAER